MGNIDKLAREYQSTWVGLRDAHTHYQTTMRSLESYKGSRGYEADVNKARETYDQTVEGIHCAQAPKLRAILKDMEATIAPKTMDIPSEEAVRLLQALNMRDHIDADEIRLATETLKDSPTAMKSLGDIALRAGTSLPSGYKSWEDQKRDALGELTEAVNGLLAWRGQSADEVSEAYFRARSPYINDGGEAPQNAFTQMEVARYDMDGACVYDAIKQMLGHATYDAAIRLD